MAYQTLREFKDRTVAPASYIDALEKVRPGWVAIQLEMVSRWVDSKLIKRYAVPFSQIIANPGTETEATESPELVKLWVTNIVTLRVYLKRGIDQTDEQYTDIKKIAEQTELDVAEAANSETGLIELPLKNTDPASAVVKAGPRSYSEQSPYVFMDGQRSIGRVEDSNRGGTRG